jgi:restriction system protein
MPIPDYQTLMYPLLKLAENGKSRRIRDSIVLLVNQFSLTEEEKKALLPSSGSETVFNNRVRWACTYLKQAKLLESLQRGVFKITPRGKELLHSGISKIDNSVLEQYPEFQAFKNRKKKKEVSDATELIESSTESNQTPEDQIDSAYQIIKKGIQKELLENIIRSSSSFFERLVIDLVVSMGYGGSRLDAGKAVGKSGDEGIDGIINEDKLGLDVIYIQAKCWREKSVVGRPEIQKFAGALQGQKARKGIFITTSSFTQQALNYVSTIDSKIILIDGDRLSNLMFEHSVGVSNAGVYELKKIDSDYFEEN